MRRNFVSMTCRATVSRGCPFFSYMASRKKGIMMIIMSIKAKLLGSTFLVRKYSGMPVSAPLPKQMSCLFVKLKKSLVLILDRSLGTSA